MGDRDIPFICELFVLLKTFTYFVQSYLNSSAHLQEHIKIVSLYQFLYSEIPTCDDFNETFFILVPYNNSVLLPRREMQINLSL